MNRVAHGPSPAELKAAVKTSPFPLLLVFFFCSGVSGLIYEITWMRRLGLTFGTSHVAAIAVLTVFMTGLAAGYYWGSKLLKINKDCFRLYAYLELFIGGYGFFSIFLLDVTDVITYSLSNSWPELAGMEITSFCVPFGLSFLFLLLPTIAMGATLPIVAHGAALLKGKIGAPVSYIYGLNTFGGVAGAGLGGLILIPWLGIQQTIITAAVLNVCIGIGALFLRSTAASDRKQKAGGQLIAAKVDLAYQDNVRRTKLLLVAYALSGMVSLSCEIAWTRGMILSFGSSVYSFAIVLMTFLLGIGLGSVLYKKVYSAKIPTAATFGYLQWGMAFGILLSILFIGQLPFLFLLLFEVVGHSLFFIFSGELILACLALLIPTTLMGILFPVVTRLLTLQLAQTGKVVGLIGAYNTIGAVIGILLSGLLLIPLLGSETTLRLAVVINISLGFIFVLLLTKNRSRSGILLFCLLLIYLVVTPSWKPEIIAQGVFQYAPQYEEAKLPKMNVLYCEDGWTSQVAITEQNNIRSLRINGKADGSDGSDMRTQVLLAELPLFFAPKYDSVFILGLGTGVTLGTVLQSSVQAVVCCEIETRVLEAARYFNHVNGSALHDNRAKIILDDARSVLRNQRGSFDIIINEPSNPWIRGIANLFSVEFFQLCHSRLTNDGVICQWLHLYGMNPENVRTALRSFFTVFPNAMIWEGSKGDILLVGAKKPFMINRDFLEARFDQHRKTLQKIDITELDHFLEGFVCSAQNVQTWIEDAPLNTDDKPILEFSTPLNLYRDLSQQHIVTLYTRGCAETVLSGPDQPYDQFTEKIYFRRALKLLQYEASQCAHTLFRRMYERNRSNPAVVFNLAMIELYASNLDQAESLLQASLLHLEDPSLHFGLAQVYARKGDRKTAVEWCQKALQLEPDFEEVQVLLNTLNQMESSVMTP